MKPAMPNLHIMAKPAGPICNLDCAYCFYLEKEKLYPGHRQLADWRMPASVLERYIEDFIASQPGSEVQFAWQGGEPTLLGVDFFREVVRLQSRHAGGKRCSNALQTNATLLDDTWGEFLAEHRFLVGISLDGPQKLHDRYRTDKGGQPTFRQVMRGLEALRRHDVEFNTLTCIQRHNADYPLEIYQFLKDTGSRYLQFIPVVERAQGAADAVTPWSLLPRQLGQFLIAVFDEWIRRDVGSYYIQLFEVTLANWMGWDPGLCIFRETCGGALALEHNGDLYSCDHFVAPEHRLGNLMERPLAELAQSPTQIQFGLAKRDTLPRYCRECEVRFACHGECPKNRFITTPDGEPGLNYLCEGYKAFFQHVTPYMNYMAEQLRQQHTPTSVMQWAHQETVKPASMQRGVHV